MKYIYVVQFIFNFELKYNEIAAVYMYIYCIYVISHQKTRFIEFFQQIEIFAFLCCFGINK